ncbi:MAG: molybdopterin oxidoreductase [Verrucomicrobia bacterium]|nr:MAG: molybdopterin oxidoreductase [Verrucomicrobiota bacterium]
MKQETLDLAAIRTRLTQARGKEYWRSLEELAGTEAFQELLQQEFPRQASVWSNEVGRREFLKLMGASLALAGLSACGSPAPTDEKIVPYVRQPEETMLGKPMFFATAFTLLGGVASGLLVESHEGRPTKIEGNPNHPASLGSTDAMAQASILTLYDPDRSQAVNNAGRISTWNAFLTALNGELEGERLSGGAGLRILTETVTSPTLATQLGQFLAKFPKAKWHQYEPVNRDNVRAGARLAFGDYVNTYYRLDRADVILALDSDFLLHGPGSVRYARDFAARRKVRQGQTEMNRLYVVETTPSITGAMADHRLAFRPSEIASFVRSIASGLGISTGPTREGPHAQWIGALARDLKRHRGSSLVIAGDQQTAEVHALAHAMNQVLDNVGKTIICTDPVEASPLDQMASLRALVRDMEAGQVKILVMLGGNPVFTAPADLRFAEQLSSVGLRVHLGLYDDETSALCHWHIPETHYLESWSDTRAYDGTVTILQPLIAPLYDGKSAHELLAVLTGQPGVSSYDVVRNYWKQRSRSPDFELFWRTALHQGLIAGTAFPPKPVKLKSLEFFSQAAASSSVKAETRNPNSETQNTLEIIFRPDPTIFDGRFANNGWLQELPKPLTKLTWDNAVLVSPATAERLGLGHQIGTTGGEHGRIFADMVELRLAGRTLRSPVWITPGHADGCATVYFGYGRTRAGRVGTGTGFNTYAIRTSEALWHGAGLEIRKTSEQYPLACTQFHHNMEGRDLVRVASIEEYRKNPNWAQESSDPQKTEATLYPPHKYEGYAWGMAIDVNACIGCNACVVACQAENNIPVVGKNEVTRGREMHWLRVDRYYKGDLDSPETYHQPVPCMHCENAPCELVCPVGATNHSAEGLNDMVYNRCVGTRYCSNNCPYKVRRFNFLQYSDFTTPSLKLLRNPNVTVRSRGVMEKCTYCIQRINTAKIAAEKEDRQVRDGEVVTACQAACPAEAIVFGDINAPDSHVSKLKAESRNYALLTELNTRPRTTYLAKLRNPNPEIEKEERHGS